MNDGAKAWDAARSAPLTPDELRVIAERAEDCASDNAIKQTHSNWTLRAGLWAALAQAAFACEAMLARDTYYSLMGEPEQRKPDDTKEAP